MARMTFSYLIFWLAWCAIKDSSAGVDVLGTDVYYIPSSQCFGDLKEIEAAYVRTTNNTEYIQDCIIRFMATGTKRVFVQILHQATTNCFSRVSIYDAGDAFGEANLELNCHSSLPRYYESTSSHLTIRLRMAKKARLPFVVMLLTSFEDHKTKNFFGDPNVEDPPCAEFNCNDSRCISFQLVCDGYSNCQNATDETNCPEMHPLDSEIVRIIGTFTGATIFFSCACGIYIFVKKNCRNRQNQGRIIAPPPPPTQQMNMVPMPPRTEDPPPAYSTVAYNAMPPVAPPGGAVPGEQSYGPPPAPYGAPPPTLPVYGAPPPTGVAPPAGFSAAATSSMGTAAAAPPTAGEWKPAPPGGYPPQLARAEPQSHPPYNPDYKS